MLTIFFKKTHFFWVISRYLLIVLFLSTFINQLKDKSLGSIIVCGILFIVIMWMLFISIMEFRKKEVLMPIKVMTGVFSIFFGMLLTYLILTLGSENYSFTKNLGFLIIPAWLILYGIWEFRTTKK